MRNRLSGKSRNRATYFRRLIWLVFICVCIPVVLIGSIYYKLSVSHLTEELKSQYMTSLKSTMDSTEDRLATIEYDSLHFSGSLMVRESFFRESFKNDYVYHGNLLDSMLTRKNVNPPIQEMIYYNDQYQIVLSTDYGYVQKNKYSYDADIDRGFSLNKQAGWMYLPDASSRGYISYVRLLPVIGSAQAQGALITHVKEEALSQEFQKHNESRDYLNYRIIDSSGVELFSSRNEGIRGLDVSTDPLYKQISDIESRSGIVYGEDENGKATLYLFSKTLLDRVYITSLSEIAISEQLGWIKFVILYTVLIFLVIGLIMSYICSRFVYNPVERLIQQGKKLTEKQSFPQTSSNEFEYITECLHYMHEQAESLNKHLKVIEPNIRDQFIGKVIKGEIWDKERIQSECKTLQIEEDHMYTVIVVTPEKAYKFLPEEWPLTTFAIANIMKELLNKYELCGYISNGDGMETIALVYSNDQHANGYINRDRLNRFAEHTCDEVKKCLSLNVSVGVGSEYSGLKKTSESYQEALLALQNRMYKTSSPINYFDSNENTKKQTMFFYPRELELEIVDYLNKGEQDLTEQSLKKFADVVRASESYNLIYQSYHVLLSSIIRSIEQKGIGLLEIMENNWFDQLKSRKTTGEIVDWFIEVLFPLYFDIIEENQNLSGRLAVQKVWQHVKENIGINISLTECAELVGMSPSYLSRLFRRETGISFVDYVKRCKVEEAKKLLRDKDMNIIQIAQTVGYSERNLSRVFKDAVGMSPGQFRSDHR
ncbi:helix-turn-helix domain-containing protein [Alkalicoccobacillus plakortidis]|uniref:AraC family transcriptional regulator n=1 Tax=Alkalicoccobacillus plakortidis TaxID=444060 RepID=A0ABT0XQG3_9BACI|nr:helix-turn-helix domain-containing protein [Alkalicoccobacillus plakortidis]MCM2677955.1 AraC family transcriptional regulator [Alkalicoccobacillus plakortidis]